MPRLTKDQTSVYFSSSVSTPQIPKSTERLGQLIEYRLDISRSQLVLLVKRREKKGPINEGHIGTENLREKKIESGSNHGLLVIFML